MAAVIRVLPSITGWQSTGPACNGPSTPSRNFPLLPCPPRASRDRLPEDGHRTRWCLYASNSVVQFCFSGFGHAPGFTAEAGPGAAEAAGVAEAVAAAEPARAAACGPAGSCDLAGKDSYAPIPYLEREWGDGSYPPLSGATSRPGSMTASTPR